MGFELFKAVCVALKYVHEALEHKLNRCAQDPAQTEHGLTAFGQIFAHFCFSFGRQEHVGFLWKFRVLLFHSQELSKGNQR